MLACALLLAFGLSSALALGASTDITSPADSSYFPPNVDAMSRLLFEVVSTAIGVDGLAAVYRAQIDSP
jgi:hypothetical protein